MSNNNTSHVDGGGWKDASFLITVAHYPVLSLLIIAVNSCVIIAVWSKRILQKWQNYLLVSLACSDLSVGLLCLPLALLCTMAKSQHTGCILCLVAYTFTKLLSVSTILHLVTITYERFLFIVYPFYHERLSAKHVRFKLVLVGVWFISLVVAVVPYAWSNLAKCSDVDNARQWVLYTIITLILFLIVPMILLIFAFCSMFMVAKVHIRKHEALTRLSGLPNSNSNATRKEARVVIIFVLMWAVFVICWTPYFVLDIAGELGVEMEVPDRLWEAANVLRFLTSLLNPLLYTFLKKDFCQALGLTWIARRGVFRGRCLSYRSRCNAQQEVPLNSNVAMRLCHSETGNQGLITQLSTV